MSVTKVMAVFKREYLAAVRKKMFMIMTALFPVLMAGLFFIPTLMISRSLGDKKVAVVDGSGRLRDVLSKPLHPEAVDAKKATEDLAAKKNQVQQTLNLDYEDAHGRELSTAAKPYLDKLRDDAKGKHLYDAVLLIPQDVFTNDKAVMTFYSRSATDIFTQERLSSETNHAIQRQRLNESGIDPKQVDRIMARVGVDQVQMSRAGEKKKGGDQAFLFGFMLAALLLIPSFVYGLEIMRGIVQEKNDRVVEVLISSMSPTELLTGKIAGVAAVGLTQIGAWLVLFGGLGVAGKAVAKMADLPIGQFLTPSFFIFFIVFFLLGYLTNVCVYAIAGAACNTDKEAQQLIGPLQMVMMLPWFLMAAIITNPESSMAVGFSLAPVFGPLTMFVRTLVSEPPVWHVAVSIVTSILTICVFFYATAKIFRVGILSYGKRPTLPELWRWLKVA
jgi:ABC-2 type transport system permease protein